MRQAIKEYFRESQKAKDVETKVLLHIREYKLKRWKTFSAVIFGLNLFLITFFLTKQAGSEYKTMSGGYEVYIREDVSFSQIDHFLKKHYLFIKGPTPEGTYLIEGADAKTLKAIENSNLFKLKD